MSETHFNALRDTLKTIPDADVKAPDIPMGAYLLEANAILTYLDNNPDILTELLSAGPEVDQGELTGENILVWLEERLGAARHAQALRDAMRSPRKPSEAREQEDKGYTLRRELMAACRWNLRKDRVSQGTLDAIQQGEGIADLITDLDAEAVLILNNKKAFARDKRFNAEAKALEAQEMAQTLRANQVGFIVSQEGSAAVALRDRAWTHLDEMVDEIRAGARYVFGSKPEILHYFQSPYARRRNMRYRTKSGSGGGGSAVTV